MTSREKLLSRTRRAIVAMLSSWLALAGCNDSGVAGSLIATVDGTTRDFGRSMTIRNLEPGVLVSGVADDGSGYQLLVVAPTDMPAGTYACNAVATDRNVVLTDPSGVKHDALDGGSCTFTVTNAEGDADTTLAFHFDATLPNGASTIAVSGDAEVTGAP